MLRTIWRRSRKDGERRVGEFPVAIAALVSHLISGAFGAAILYRRKDDDSLVILKEINMHDLSGQERQLALNEVSVLSQLDHPHIISYYDSFEEDGVLMIEMEYAEGG